MVAVLHAVRGEFVMRGIPEAAKEESCWLEASAVVRELGLDPFLQEQGLAQVDLGPRVAALEQARTPGLEGADSHELINLWARARGEPGAFRNLLKKSWNRGHRQPGWGAAEVQAAVARVIPELQKLAEENPFVSYSSRLTRAGWSVNISSTWYPFSREVHVFVVGTSECSSSHSARSTLLKLKALVDVSVGESGNRVYQVSLEEVAFDLRCCETRFSGHWTEEIQTPGGPVTLVNSLALKVVGTRVHGRLLQGVAQNGEEPSRGRVVYTLDGRVAGGESMEGTFQMHGDERILQWLDGGRSRTGTWTGRIDARRVAGKLVIDGGPTLEWRATEQAGS